MIPLTLPSVSEAELPFVTRLRLSSGENLTPNDSCYLGEDSAGATFSGAHGLFAIDGASAEALDGDVMLVSPGQGRAERLLRSARGSNPTNTLLVTERCDQLCVMCSQPPKKTHDDRFDLLEQAALLAEPGSLIGITGGEPTLYKDQLLAMMESVLKQREDIQFHVLTNAQHFIANDVERLAGPAYNRVTWGVPIYARDPKLHDRIVGKEGAFYRLEEGLAVLLDAGCRVELRTVLLSTNAAALPALATYVTTHLRFIEVWSIMQLEHIGFARRRWPELYYRHDHDFATVAAVLDRAHLHGVHAQLFNFPRCTVPAAYRHLAQASISDWKRKFMPECAGCGEQEHCSGFFEWHPDDEASAMVGPI